MPSSKMLEYFEAVSSHLVLSKTVQDLVYDEYLYDKRSMGIWNFSIGFQNSSINLNDTEPSAMTGSYEGLKHLFDD